jgi:FkbM family methyltransferase
MKTMGNKLMRMQFAYRAYRESKQHFRNPTRTPGGFWLAGNEAMESGQFERTETDAVLRLFNDTEVMINIGANIGYYCCLALQQNKQVVAFEPFPQNVNLLLRNIQLNGWSEAIEVFPLALGSQPGVIEIWGGGTGASLLKGWAGQADRSTLVPISTLDIVLGNRFHGAKCLIITDIEGAELQMLRGATKMLQNQPKPIWMVEVSINEHQPAGVTINPNLLDTFKLFDAAGYGAFVADATERPVTLEEVSKVFQTGVDTLMTHNFIFRAR